MKKRKTVRKPVTAMLLLFVLCSAVFARLASAEMGQIDGHIWDASSVNEKRSYLTGVANVVSVNRALRIERDNLDPDGPLTRLADALDGFSIDGAITRIDGWYSADKDRLDTPVIGVIWLGIVEAAK